MLDARSVIADVLNVQAENILKNARMDDLPEWDSLGHMRIVMRLEEIIGRSLETEEMLTIENVASIQHILDMRV